MFESWFGGGQGSEHTSVIVRSESDQAEVDDATRQLKLYYYGTCGFCRRVRSTIERLDLKIELRDIHREPANHRRLRSDGGSGTVPCLLIEDAHGATTWLYESRDIIAYLEHRFGAEPAQ